jgi:clathrin heavy chain
MLYACYDLIPLHKVMELSWRHGLSDFTMPFMINYMSQQASAIDTLRRDNEERKAREVSTQKPEDDGPILGQSRLLLTQAPQQTGLVMAERYFPSCICAVIRRSALVYEALVGKRVESSG